MEMSNSINVNFRASGRLVKPSNLDGGDGFCHCFYCELGDPLSRMIIDDNHSSKNCICRKVLLASVCYNRSHYCLYCSKCGCFACAMKTNVGERKLFNIGEVISKCTRCHRVDISETCASSGRTECLNCQFAEEEEEEVVDIGLGGVNTENLYYSFCGGIMDNSADLQALEEELFEEPSDGVVAGGLVANDVVLVEGNIPPPTKRSRIHDMKKIIKVSRKVNSGKKLTHVQSGLPSFLISTQFASPNNNDGIYNSVVENQSSNSHSMFGGVVPARRQSLLNDNLGPSSDINTPCSSGAVSSSGNTQRNLSSLTKTTSSVSNISSQRTSSLDNNSTIDDVDCNSTTDGKKSRSKKSLVWVVCVLDKSREDDVRIKCVCGWASKYTSGTSCAANHIKKCEQARNLIAKTCGDGDEGIVSTYTSIPGHFSSIPILLDSGRTVLAAPAMDPKQALLAFLPDGSLSAKHRARDYASVNLRRGRLAEMILLDKQPFAAVDRIGFRRFLECVAPHWNCPHRQTVGNDIEMTVYPELKKRIKEGILVDTDSDTGYSLTTDIWYEEHSKSNFVSLTLHWITCSLELRYCTIGFEPIFTPHSGRNIAAIVYRILRDFGIDNRIMSVTLDNASNNTTFLTSLRQLGFQFLFDGRYSHTRCNGHIINLIVKDGLQKLKSEISALRWYVKLFNSSSSKREEFNKLVQDIINPSKKLAKPCLDIHTRWNATHDMIGSCLPYAVVFDEMSGKAIPVVEVDPITRESTSTQQVTPSITQQGWSNLQKLHKFLHPMKEATELLSARKKPTLHLVMYSIQAIKKTIDGADEIVGTDEQFTSAADSMAVKFNKYYENIDSHLIIAHVLDPRAKLHYLRKVHSSSLYSDRLSIDQLMNTYYQDVMEAFQFYSTTSVDQRVSSTNNHVAFPERSSSTSVDHSVFYEQFELLSDDNNNCDTTNDLNELDTYLREPSVKNNAIFDLLQWWKLNEHQFPTLFRMAKHFFGICASSVPSESLFSISGQVLDEHRASLGDERQHICVAGEQWLEALIRYTNVWPQPQYVFQGQYKKVSSLPDQDIERQGDSKAQDED